MREKYLRRLIRIVEESDIGSLEVHYGIFGLKLRGFIITKTRSGKTIEHKVETPVDQPSKDREGFFERQRKRRERMVLVKSGDEYFAKYAIGGFYLTEDPENPESVPVIKKGSLVKEGDVLYYVDTLKLHNPVPAPYDCTVRRIFLREGESFDHGTKLLLLEKTEKQ